MRPVAMSDPSAPAEKEKERRSCCRHQSEGEEITIVPFQLRHVLEIHAVDPADDGQRQHDGGEDGQHFHDLVGAVGDDREVGLHGAGHHVALHVDGLADAEHVVVEIAEVDEVLLLDEGRVAARDLVEQLALRERLPAQR